MLSNLFQIASFNSSNFDTASVFPIHSSIALSKFWVGVREFSRGRKNDTATIYLSAKWVIDIMVDGLKFATAPEGPKHMSCVPPHGQMHNYSPYRVFTHLKFINRKTMLCLSVRLINPNCTFSIWAL